MNWGFCPAELPLGVVLLQVFFLLWINKAGITCASEEEEEEEEEEEGRRSAEMIDGGI